jgi:hypothetical protein
MVDPAQVARQNMQWCGCAAGPLGRYGFMNRWIIRLEAFLSRRGVIVRA